MKRSIQTGLAAAVILLQLSCKYDVVESKPPECPCRIEKITQNFSGIADRTGTFTYNASGDPETFTPIRYSTGSVKYEFRYDNKRRLTDYIGYYPSTSINPVCEFWNKYYYDANDRVIMDSSFHYPIYGPVMSGNILYKGYSTYEYDSEGRISRSVKRQLINGVPNGIVQDYKYVYNADGNLVLPGAEYDDKVSVYQSSRIWMFLNRNYSKNNIRKGTSYNTYGLPLSFDKAVPGVPSLGMLYFFGLTDVNIEYKCE